MIVSQRLNRLPAAERGITIGDFLVPVSLGERISTRARHLALIIVGALFIALTAQFVILRQPVPITGQTLGVLLVGGALGSKRGAGAALLYVVLGFFVPVYAEHTQGLARIIGSSGGHLVLGTTGGYLLGFIVAAAVIGRLAELGWDRNVLGAIAAFIVGNLVIYAFGVPWLMLATGLDLGGAVTNGVSPFLLVDGLKILVAAALFPAAWWLVGRRPAER
ncbi:MAG: biotin transporter BioY [Candidatus Limnocylindrales bacterium]